MSYKSVVNNKRKQIRFVVLAEEGWSSGYTTGHNIPLGKCKNTSCRFLGNKILHNENYGKLIDISQYEQMNYERGILIPYTRNMCRFVMSRAARKRGFTTDCFRYHSYNERKKYENKVKQS